MIRRVEDEESVDRNVLIYRECRGKAWGRAEKKERRRENEGVQWGEEERRRKKELSKVQVKSKSKSKSTSQATLS